MPIDPELLWRAFPDGYLATRGVSTVGGWTCFDANNPTLWMVGLDGEAFHVWNGTIYHPFRCEASWVKAQITAGKLLPNVNPSDTATWACLLAELGRVAGLQEWRTLDFYRDGTKHRWMLWAFRPGSSETRAFRGPLFDTNDPALALVRALIHLREGGDAR